MNEGNAEERYGEEITITAKYDHLKKRWYVKSASPKLIESFHKELHEALENWCGGWWLHYGQYLELHQYTDIIEIKDAMQIGDKKDE